MSDLRETIAAATRESSNAFLEGLQPPIEVKVARCSDYSALLRGEHKESSRLDELIERAAAHGRVIICGRGASGKSALLHRAAIQAGNRGLAPFFINLSHWDQAATAAWQTARENARDALGLLLYRFGVSEHDVTDAEFLQPNIQKLFLLDGLNETPGSTADEILATCDQIASILVGAAVIVTDRLVRRSLASEGKWCFVMPLPVENDEVDRLMSGKHVPEGAEALLRSPFFLDRALQGELRRSPLATIRALVETRGQLDATGLAVAAEAAFRAYEIDRSRTFSRLRFADLGREDVADTLLEGGILVDLGDNKVAFNHHWYHDYLASKHVAEHHDLWSFQDRHRILDILTFKANSFDAIAFVLELLPVDASGTFLQAVYDWNPYAAGYALSEAGISIEDVPRGVRLIILAMLAEKRFDRHFHSARRAADALDLLSDEDAKRMRAALTLNELLSFVAEIEPPSEEFASWQAFFTASQDHAALPRIVEALADEDSMIGWTAANVLKRLRLEDELLGAIRSAAVHDRPVVRWRAVHAMGGFAIDQCIAALSDRLDNDQDENVRYGALRSMIEIASRDQKILPGIVAMLIERLDAIERSPKVLGELSRAVFLNKSCAPPDWTQEISRIFYSLLERSKD